MPAEAVNVTSSFTNEVIMLIIGAVLGLVAIILSGLGDREVKPKE